MGKNSDRGFSKGKLFASLKALGLEVHRNFETHKWVLSNGEEFDSLSQIANKYKIQK